jgi:mediator of RNA polymerase II transcription subunit 13, fungi type
MSVSMNAYNELSPKYSYIPDTEEETAVGATIVRPLASASLVRVPAGNNLTSATMAHLHLLHSTHLSQPVSSFAEHTTLDDIAQNYYDLSLLAKHRWNLTRNAILPLHLAALEVMSAVLTTDEYLMD